MLKYIGDNDEPIEDVVASLVGRDFLILLPESFDIGLSRAGRFIDEDGSQCDSSMHGKSEVLSGDG